MTSGFSVIVCTYNRAAWLGRALGSLCDQGLPQRCYEVLVVDNRSTDGTREVALAAAAEQPNIRYLYEPELGLSHARNTGWRAAAFPYVAYLDDDCEVPAHWLATAGRIVEQVAPAAFSGPSRPLFHTKRPAWFLDRYGSYTPCTVAGPAPRPDHFSGHNLFLRRDLVAALGGFDPSYGMSGGAVAYGEDTDLLHRLFAAHPQAGCYCDPDLYVFHLVRPEQTRWSWLLRSRFAKGRAARRIWGNRPGSLVPAARNGALGLASLARLAWAAGPGWVLRDRRRYPAAANYFYEVALPLVERLGRALPGPSASAGATPARAPAPGGSTS